MLQHFIIHNRHMGYCERPDLIAVQGELAPPVSVAYFCPSCGEVWARAAIDNRPFMVHVMPCNRHPQQDFGLRVPGALTLPWDAEYSNSFPQEVAAWEFMRHLEWVERKGI
jgi:hypothetical protein